MKKLLVQMSGILVGFASQVGVSMAQQTFDTRPLTGFAEVPAIFSAGSGNFKITFFGNPATQLNYQLSFSGLAGGATQGHVRPGKSRRRGDRLPVQQSRECASRYSDLPCKRNGYGIVN